MPCRVCGAKISRDAAAQGSCSECGNRLRQPRREEEPTPPRMDFSVEAAPSKREKRRTGGSRSRQPKFLMPGIIAASVVLFGVLVFVLLRSYQFGGKPADETAVTIAKPPVMPQTSSPEPAAIAGLGASSGPAASPGPAAVPEPEVLPETPEPEPPLPPAPEEPRSEIAELLKQHQILPRKDIALKVEECLKLVKDSNTGHVVVGQLKMEGDASPSDAISQMEILDDGYFVDAVATASAPVYFWSPGFDRLEVIPRGQKGALENLGVVTMKRQTKEAASIRATLVANGSEVPKDLVHNLTFSIPILNQQLGIGKTRASVQTALLERLKPEQSVKVEFNNTNGELLLSGLPELRCDINLSTPLSDAYLFSVDASNGDVLSLGSVDMFRRSVAAQTAVNLDSVVPAPYGRPLVEELLKELRNDPIATQYFKENLYPSIEKIEIAHKGDDWRKTVVIVGKIEVPDRELDGMYVDAQMRICKGGYFCAAVRTGTPVGFRLHGYEPLDYIPRSSRDCVDYCGVLKMKRTSDRETASLEGTFEFEDGIQPTNFRISAGESVDNINWWNNSGGYQGARGNPKPPATQISGNRFTISKLSPIQYSIFAAGDGLVSQSHSIRFEQGERRTMPPTTLFRTRLVTVSSVFSKPGQFADGAVQRVNIDNNNSQWRASSDLSVYSGSGSDFSFLQSGSTILVRGFFAPCHLWDMGSRTLDECRSVDVTSLETNSASDVYLHSLKAGHTYLLNQGQWHHWVLFSVDDISIASNKLK